MQRHHPTRTDGASRSGSRLALMAAWMIAWLATLALARFGPNRLWDAQPLISWVAIAVNLVVGVGMIIAYARYLRSVDELQQKILMDAMAVSLGVGLVGGLAVAAASSADLVHLSVNLTISVVVVLMALTYAVAAVLGNLRYR
jgi:fluoride ion exporter CrcB/FEX